MLQDRSAPAMNPDPTFARRSGAQLLNQVPSEERLANGLAPSIISRGLIPAKPGTASEAEETQKAPAGPTAVSYGVNPGSLDVQNGLQYQSFAYGHQRLAGRRAQGTYARVVTTEQFLENPAIVRANDRQQVPDAPAPLNSVLNASAATQQDAYNRLSRYMQQHVEAARTATGTQSSLSVTGLGSQGMMRAAATMAPSIGNVRYAPRVSPAQYLTVPGRAPMDQYPYAQKRPSPYHEHQVGNIAKLRRVDTGMPNSSFASARSTASNFGAGSAGRDRLLENIVENAAAFFEQKDRPEDVIDKSRSQNRYQFNVDMLEEIFDGPDVSTKKVAGSKLQTGGRKVSPREKSVRDDVLCRLGEKMISRTHVERMGQFEEMYAKFREMDNGQTTKENGSMKIFQKLERAADPGELEKVREDYEQAHGVKFFVAPALFARKDLDCSKLPWRSGPNARIAQFP